MLIFGRQMVWFDKGADSAGGSDKNDGGTGNDTGNPGGKLSDSNNGTPPAAGITFASETDFQKKVVELLKERLEREKKQLEGASPKAAADAEAEAAKKNGKWQKVTEAKEREIEEDAKRLAEQDMISGKAIKFENGTAETA